MTDDGSFVDTNILVYAYDADAGPKHDVARDLLSRLWKSRQGIVSTQVLQEFYVTVTQKLSTRLEPAVARRVVETYEVWRVQVVDVPTILEAAEMQDLDQLSFWDALIVAAARRAGAVRILSEDLQAGRVVAGLRIENPLV